MNKSRKKGTNAHSIVQYPEEMIVFICTEPRTLPTNHQQRHQSDQQTVPTIERAASPKVGADFLRESPWELNKIGSSRKQWLVAKFLELAAR